MKTIRTNCFETNSSSTHSVTIASKKALNDQAMPLVVDGLLIPGNLSYTSAYREIESGDGGHSLQCTTYEQKAALLLHHLRSIGKWRSEIKDELFDQALKEARQQIINFSTTIEDVDLDFNSCFFADDESGRTYAESILNEDSDIESVKTKLIEHMQDVVANDDIVVLDEDNPY